MSKQKQQLAKSVSQDASAGYTRELLSPQCVAEVLNELEAIVSGADTQLSTDEEREKP